MDDRPVTRAINIRPPKIGKPSRQFACARASLLMNGERLALSGVNPFAGISLAMTIFERTASISTRRARVQTTNEVKATTVGEFIGQLQGGFAIVPNRASDSPRRSGRA